MPRRRSKHRLTVDEACDFDLNLLIGFGFPPDRAPLPLLEQAWSLRRDDLLAQSRPGQRPWAWWALEHGAAMPRMDDEPVGLFDAGELRDGELDAIFAEAEATLRKWPPPYSHMGVPAVLTIANTLRERLGLPPLRFEVLGGRRAEGGNP